MAGETRSHRPVTTTTPLRRNGQQGSSRRRHRPLSAVRHAHRNALFGEEVQSIFTRSSRKSTTSDLNSGDVLVCVKLNRLGRSTRDVLNLVHELDQKGAFLRILEPAISTNGPMGKMVLTVL